MHQTRQIQQDAPFPQEVVTPRKVERSITAIETAFHALALDACHPIALEIVGLPCRRLFLTRATTQAAQQQVEMQLRARYPQAEVRDLKSEADPLALQQGEMVSVLELRPGAASHLPLRTWTDRELEAAGTDPLVGVLAALSRVPPGMRVVAQLALVPAATTWSKANLRMAFEHPLEQERQRVVVQNRQQQKGVAVGAPGGASVVLVILALGAIVLYRYLHAYLQHLIPAWVSAGFTGLLHGKAPQLTPSQATQATIGGMVALAVLFLLFMLFDRLRSLFAKTTTGMYDQRLVQQKTERMAYRTRLRLYVIGPSPHWQLRQRWHAVNPSGKGRIQQICRHWATFCLDLWIVVGAWRSRDRERRAILSQCAAAYRQYHLASGGYFLPHLLSPLAAWFTVQTHATVPRLLRGYAGWQRRIERSTHLLTTVEVANLWHLVQTPDLADLSLLERGRARTILAPLHLTTGAGVKIGVSRHAGREVSVSLPAEVLRHHLLTVASTRKGKSTLFFHLARAALTLTHPTPTVGTPTAPATRDGLIVIDPHGDLVNLVLGQIVPAVTEQVVLIDLANRQAVVGINPLDVTLGRDRDTAVDNIVVMCKKIFEGGWGFRTEDILSYSAKTLMDANAFLVKQDAQHGPDAQYTLLDIVQLLQNIHFRRRVLAQVSDPKLIEWWRTYYDSKNYEKQNEVSSSVINKISKFASSYASRRILGQPRSTIDFRAIIQQQQILLVNTASGSIGADVAALIGATLLGLLQAAMSEQAQLNLGERRHMYVLIDEFQTITGANVQSWLAELGKYGGSVALATQSLSYLDAVDRTLRPSVLSNIDHCFAFLMSARDAQDMEKLYGIEADEFLALDDYMCYSQLSLSHQRLPPFSLHLDAPPAGDEAQARAVRQQSLQRHTTPAGRVDEMLAHAALRYLPPPKKQVPPSPQGVASLQLSVPVLTTEKVQQQKRDADRKGGDVTRDDRPVAQEEEVTAGTTDPERIPAGAKKSRRGNRSGIVAPGPPPSAKETIPTLLETAEIRPTGQAEETHTETAL